MTFPGNFIIWDVPRNVEHLAGCFSFVADCKVVFSVLESSHGSVYFSSSTCNYNIEIQCLPSFPCHVSNIVRVYTSSLDHWLPSPDINPQTLRHLSLYKAYVRASSMFLWASTSILVSLCQESSACTLLHLLYHSKATLFHFASLSKNKHLHLHFQYTPGDDHNEMQQTHKIPKRTWIVRLAESRGKEADTAIVPALR